MSVDPTRIDIETDPTTQRMSGVARHGYTPFDVPFISEIAPNLYQGGCRNGLELPEFIEHVVSLYPWEKYNHQHDVKSYLVVQMYDSEDQGYDQVDAIAKWVNVCRNDAPVLVHCQAGLNRSSLIVARALTLEGMSGADAIALIRKKRSPACLCNPAFDNWIRQELWA